MQSIQADIRYWHGWDISWLYQSLISQVGQCGFSNEKKHSQERKELTSQDMKACPTFSILDLHTGHWFSPRCILSEIHRFKQKAQNSLGKETIIYQHIEGRGRHGHNWSSSKIITVTIVNQ